METVKNKMSPLEEAGYFLNELGGLFVSGILEAKNNLLQEIKHGYFHLADIEHERVQKGEITSFTYFPETKHYLRKYF